MGNWGEEWDPELSQKQDPKGRFTINFKKISLDADKLIEETINVDDKHPKNEILKEWGGTMTAIFLLFLVMYKVLAFAVVPFCFFYLMALIKLGKAWKFFKYGAAKYWLMSIVTMIALFAVAYFVRGFILG